MAATAQDISNYNRDPKFADPSGEKMSALMFMGKNQVKIGSVPKPAIVEDKDVIVKVTGSTVCGSDLHLYHGAVPQLEKGDILGHEFCGKIESVGAGITKLKPGQRVVASFQIACGECAPCRDKLSSMCERTNANPVERGLYGGPTAGLLGFGHFVGGFAGGQAEYVRVPFGDVNLLPLPDNVPDETGLYLSDVLATSYHAVVDTDVRSGDVVAIWGAGPIGQMVATFAAQAGARKVVVIDAVPWRLELIRNAVGPHVVEAINFKSLAKGETVVGQLKALNDGRGPDVCIECAAGEYPKSWLHAAELAVGLETDTSELVNEMIESVKPFGRAGITGIYAGFCNHFNIGSLMERGVRLIGNGQAPVHKYWETLLDRIAKGDLDVLQMVSHRVRLEDLETVYEKFEKRDPEYQLQKVFVQTRFSDPPASGSPLLTTFS